MDEGSAEEAFLSMLQHAEQYLELHEAACITLKQGWFNIARARHSMGVHQVSAAMYSGHMDAQALILPSVDSPGNPATAASSEQSTATAAVPRTHLEADASSARGDVHTSAAAAEDDSSSDATSEAAASMDALPQQLQHTLLHGSSKGSVSTAERSVSELRLVTDDTGVALRMFGAAPSPYLRQSQSDFADALRQLVAVANQQRELSSACSAWEAVL